MLRIPSARLPVGLVPTLTTMTKLFAGWPAILLQMSAGSPATLCRTSNLFSGQLRSRILRYPQIVVIFDVVPVGREGWFYILVESLPHIGRAIVCILFSLEHSRVVD